MEYAFQLPEEKLLPAICPDCGAPGTRPRRVHRVAAPSPHGYKGRPSLDAFYCDLCADERSSSKTRELALFAACGLLAVSAVTAAALGWGSRALVLQIAFTSAASTLPALALSWLGAWPERKENVCIEERGETTVISCRTRQFRRALLEHGFIAEAISESPSVQPSEDSFHLGSLGPFPRRALTLGALGFTWLALLHSLGGSTVRVLVSGHQQAVLLIDGRHGGLVDPTNDEDPQAGLSTRILGGRRTLKLYAKTGESLGEQTATLWPGRTYIVAHLAPGQCLFWEQRKYGERSRPSVFSPLPGLGPVWELRHHVDSWFLPLQAPGSKEPQSEDDWQSSGGVRRAIRLRPCRSPAPP
jgi:hypothetical protein